MADELNAPESEHTNALDLDHGSSPMGEAAGQCQPVLLEHQPVELYKILKFEGLADSGAQAKHFIDEGLVSVNGAIELRRRRKIVDQDLIQLGDRTLKMEMATGD